MSTDLIVVNAALARIGCLPVATLESEDPAIVNIKRVYQTVLGDILSKAIWNCAIKTAGLSQLVTLPVRQWAYAYALPPDRLGLPRAYYQDKTCRVPLTELQLSDNQVWCDAALVWAEYLYRPVPANWPGYLTEVVVLGVAAELALSVREDAALRNRLRVDLYGSDMYQGEGGQFGVAQSLEAQSHPSPQVQGGYNPLMSVRHSPGGGDYGEGDARAGYWNWP